MPPSFPEFRDIRLEDRGLFGSPSGPRGCEYSFANLFIWRDFDRPAITSINNSTCVMMRPVIGEPFFLEPQGGAGIEDTVEECIRHAGRVSRVSEELAARLEKRGYRARPLPEHFDYVYRTADLAAMSGRRFDGKRNHMRRMAKAHPGLEYRTLSPSDAASAFSLFDAWREARTSPEGEGRSPMAFSCQRDALSRLFENFEELGAVGGKLVIDGEIAGFVVGTAAHASEACVHFCYTRPGLSGAFPFLVRESCRGCFSTFEFVNLEQDLGIAGLRKNKMSFHPARLEEKYEITMEGG